LKSKWQIAAHLQVVRVETMNCMTNALDHLQQQAGVQREQHRRSTQHSPPPSQLLVWSGHLREHLLQALSSQLRNKQSIWQQYQFYRIEDFVWQLLYFELYWTLFSHDRRQSTPASSLQTYLTTGVCLSTLLFQARRPSEHTFHFKHM